MATIISIGDLERWIQADSGDLAGNAFAADVIEMASGLVCDVAGAPAWEIDVTPPREAKRICLLVAARTYLNPTSNIAETVGPLSERHSETWGYTMQLTEAETAALVGLGDSGSPSSGLWVLPISAGTPPVSGDVLLWDEAGAWAITYGTEGEVAFREDDVI